MSYLIKTKSRSQESENGESGSKVFDLRWPNVIEDLPNLWAKLSVAKFELVNAGKDNREMVDGCESIIDCLRLLVHFVDVGRIEDRGTDPKNPIRKFVSIMDELGCELSCGGLSLKESLNKIDSKDFFDDDARVAVSDIEYVRKAILYLMVLEVSLQSISGMSSSLRWFRLRVCRMTDWRDILLDQIPDIKKRFANMFAKYIDKAKRNFEFEVPSNPQEKLIFGDLVPTSKATAEAAAAPPTSMKVENVNQGGSGVGAMSEHPASNDASLINKRYDSFNESNFGGKGDQTSDMESANKNLVVQIPFASGIYDNATAVFFKKKYGDKTEEISSIQISYLMSMLMQLKALLIRQSKLAKLIISSKNSIGKSGAELLNYEFNVQKNLQILRSQYLVGHSAVGLSFNSRNLACKYEALMNGEGINKLHNTFLKMIADRVESGRYLHAHAFEEQQRIAGRISTASGILLAAFLSKELIGTIAEWVSIKNDKTTFHFFAESTRLTMQHADAAEKLKLTMNAPQSIDVMDAKGKILADLDVLEKAYHSHEYIYNLWLPFACVVVVAVYLLWKSYSMPKQISPESHSIGDHGGHH